MSVFYLMVDCNNFYASCERAFRPALEGRPVVVLSNNDGCIIARSNEAKALGIAMGEPAHLREDFLRLHGVHVFSSNYALYGDMSARVMDILAGFARHTEVYSIDECFLRVDGLSTDSLYNLARDIRCTVRLWTGIPVCVGIARTKTLAKAANRLAKKYGPDGTWRLDAPDDIDLALITMHPGDIWGIGRKNARYLAACGVRNALDLKGLPQDWVRRHLTVTGLRTVLELNGTPCIDLDDTPPPARSLVVSRSFGKRLESRDLLEEAVSSFAQRAGEKLRRRGLVAGALQVFIQTNRHTPDAQYAGSLCRTLPVATEDTLMLHAPVVTMLREIFKPGYKYQKAGVILLELAPAGNRQLSFLDAQRPARTRRTKLMQALDAINTRHGHGTLTLASSGLGDRPWHMRQARRSPRYTTCWEELPVVLAN